MTNHIQYITILGSTGSIGENTLDVIARHSERFKIFALTGCSRIQKLVEQAQRFSPQYVVVPDIHAAQAFNNYWLISSTKQPQILIGSDALIQVAIASEVSIVMAAIVGAAGLPPTLAAAKVGKRILLANKEALVVGGALFMESVAKGGAQLLPIDSEHNAIFQCIVPLGNGFPAEVSSNIHGAIKKLVLTASGGPFRNIPLSDLKNVTPAQACAHPNWMMGRKISVDSATMINKGLEIIEAHWLFSMPAKQISVVIHPQSVVHSMVEYQDGSVLAQLGLPDMRTPIAYGLGFPARLDAGVQSLDLTQYNGLTFEAVDYERFPGLAMAYAALNTNQQACIVFNAANEVAVERFLKNKLGFTQITEVIGEALDNAETDSILPDSLENLLNIDAYARRLANQIADRLYLA